MDSINFSKINRNLNQQKNTLMGLINKCITNNQKLINMQTKKLYESPLKERNEQKYGLLTDQCICCGKPMKEGEKLYIHMNTNWVAVNPLINEENCKELTGAESQGCFPIGNDCAKKMKGFTFLMK